MNIELQRLVPVKAKIANKSNRLLFFSFKCAGVQGVFFSGQKAAQQCGAPADASRLAAAAQEMLAQRHRQGLGCPRGSDSDVCKSGDRLCLSFNIGAI